LPLALFNVSQVYFAHKNNFLSAAADAREKIMWKRLRSV
jgi:hypothetical protein